MNLILKLLGAIPFPRLRRPPPAPTTIGERVFQNRVNPASRWTCGNHIAANVSDIFFRWWNGISGRDVIYRDRNNRLLGSGRRVK